MSAALARQKDLEDLARHVSKVMQKVSGNILGENQISMVMGLMSKRLIDLGDMLPSEYIKYLEKNYDTEIKALTGLLTTHHTFFFREFLHFEHILKMLPSLAERAKKRGSKTINIYCAACSRGHEVYSLAMFLAFHMPKVVPGIDFKILGTDIDAESVTFARNGVYPHKEVISIPRVYLDGNWQRGTGDIAIYAKVKDNLKKYCRFDTENLLDNNHKMHSIKYDIIFCRNVFIYFDRENIKKVCERFRDMLLPSGYLITGLSESLKAIDLGVYACGPSVYTFDAPENAPQTASIPSVAQASPVLARPLRVLCVDDSASVLKLLTKIFTTDNSFELVGTAMNGIEAQEFLKKNSVDVMTLDIHMPEMDGVTYLEKNMREGHPAVVVVSSASREDTAYAQKTLQFGASDFVEKPALNNISERADEIKTKLKMAHANQGYKYSETVDTQFKRSFEIKNPDKALRVVLSNFSDLKKVRAYVKSVQQGPPICLVFEGNNNFMEMFLGQFTGEFPGLVELFPEGGDIKSNKIYLLDLKADFEGLLKASKERSISICVFGACTKSAQAKISSLGESQLLLDDVPEMPAELKSMATDVFPWTSFAHVSTEYLAKKGSSS